MDFVFESAKEITLGEQSRAHDNNFVCKWEREIEIEEDGRLNAILTICLFLFTYLPNLPFISYSIFNFRCVIYFKIIHIKI